MGRWGMTEIGSLFEQFRRNYKKTQGELAVNLGVSLNYIWMIEKGKALPSPALLCRFCDQFGFNFNVAKRYLFNDKMELYRKEISKKLNIDNVFPP